jgi:hypothetical protein
MRVLVTGSERAGGAVSHDRLSRDALVRRLAV